MTSRRPADTLRQRLLPGDPVSLDEAAGFLRGDRARASQALTHLVERGDFVHVRRRLWVRAGAPPDPYRLSARVVSPYAFVYGTALALHGAESAMRSEFLIASPRRFDSFEYEGVYYRRALPWPEKGRTKVSVGPEFVWCTTPERTIVDCVRVPTNAGGFAELLRAASALPRLKTAELLRWVDDYQEANLAARLGFLLEAANRPEARDELLDELSRRRPTAPFYLEPASRGGTLLQRWNLIVPDHLLPARVEVA